jgi:glutamate synthase (NADPH/NADH) large chain
MSKMGISTYQSYCGAQIFDAIGLRSDFVAKYFAGTHTRIEGVGLAEIAEETVRRHIATRSAMCRSTRTRSMSAANTPSARAARITHGPRKVSLLQHAVRGNSQDRYRAFAKTLNEQSERLLTMRGLFRIKRAERRQAQAHAAR